VTPDPFIARTLPTADESLVAHCGKMELAMRLMFTPTIMRLAKRRDKVIAR
jgi:phosphoribulokinase